MASAHTAAKTKLIRCKPSCSSAYQDKHYDAKRVHNPTKTGFRCTVCGDHKTQTSELAS